MKGNIMTKLHVELGPRGYDITVGKGLLPSAGQIFNLKRRVLILTDSGVPTEYAKTVADCCEDAKIITVREGEGSKSLSTLEQVLAAMAKQEMGRGDCLVAVGGGVVGDLGGFAAATYMRGIDFYNIPTTLLSQLDSSVGGKTAVNIGGIKNLAGAFHQPRGVIIDTGVLKTLPTRQLSAGIAEAVKMSLTSDGELFSYFESCDDCFGEGLEKIIISSLKIKKWVVENDEKEIGLRKILNFGHTLGHGIESQGQLYHGECVALGMLPFCSDSVRQRLVPVLQKLRLPTSISCDIEKAATLALYDKKRVSDGVVCIFVDEVGSYRTEKISFEDVISLTKKVFKEN